MVSKRSKKKRPVRRVVEKKPASHLGMLDRIIHPKEKEVRVKTFIVERPVYISSDKKFPARGYDLPEKEEPVYDSKRSRYLKEKREKEEFEDVPEEKDADFEVPEDEAGADFQDDSIDDADAGSEEDLGEEQLDEEQVKQKFAHQRGAMNSILGVWWKRALLFGIFWWLALLAFAFVMQVFGLVTVDLTRDWWVFLAIILALSMVYQKFLSGKV